MLHRSNAINSCIYPRINHIMNSNLQRKTGFIIRKDKGRQLFGIGRTSIIQRKLAKRQDHIPIILTSIHIALKKLLNTTMHSLWLPICLWMMRWRLCMFTPKSRNQSRPESRSRPGITVWNDSMRHPMPSHDGTKEQLRYTLSRYYLSIWERIYTIWQLIHNSTYWIIASRNTR